jgi:hypothetical protein
MELSFGSRIRCGASSQSAIPYRGVRIGKIDESIEKPTSASVSREPRGSLPGSRSPGHETLKRARRRRPRPSVSLARAPPGAGAGSSRTAADGCTRGIAPRVLGRPSPQRAPETSPRRDLGHIPDHAVGDRCVEVDARRVPVLDVDRERGLWPPGGRRRRLQRRQDRQHRVVEVGQGSLEAPPLLPQRSRARSLDQGVW